MDAVALPCELRHRLLAFGKPLRHTTRNTEQIVALQRLVASRERLVVVQQPVGGLRIVCRDIAVRNNREIVK